MGGAWLPVEQRILSSMILMYLHCPQALLSTDLGEGEVIQLRFCWDDVWELCKYGACGSQQAPIHSYQGQKFQYSSYKTLLREDVLLGPLPTLTGGVFSYVGLLAYLKDTWITFCVKTKDLSAVPRAG